MLHELRTYTTPIGEAPTLARYSAELAREIRGDDYGRLEGYWTTEIGALNKCMHLWSYDSYEHRSERRAALAENDRWRNEYLKIAGPLIQRQDIRLLDPVRPLSPPPDGTHVYEYRYYRCKLGKAAQFAKLLLEALPARERYSPNVGMWITIAGQPNEVSHLWAYESLDQRAKARQAAMADPAWQDFLGRGRPMLEEMDNMILLPAAHSKLK